MRYDVFVSHASEDKEVFVDELVKELQVAGVKVWYDRFKLTIGDSLRQKIDEGLANSRYGVVVLSEAFFKKEWPKSELDGLVSRQNANGVKVILPVWLNVSYNEVEHFSLLLAGRLAAKSTDGVKAVAAQIIAECKNENTVEPKSVFQSQVNHSIREECLNIIRFNDKIAWIKILEKYSDPIPKLLLEWKELGEKSLAGYFNNVEKWQKELHIAVNQAVQICLPGFVSILASIEGGHNEFWEESLRLLRQLAVLESRMKGGTKNLIKIGTSMLFIAGSYGMALAVRTKQHQFIEQWTQLPISLYSNYGNREHKWIDISMANWFPPSIPFNSNDPFGFLLSFFDNEYVNEFFSDKKQLEQCLFVSNLLQSMIEFRDFLGNKENVNLLRKENGSDEVVFNVYPLWVMMEMNDFQDATIKYFTDSKGVLSFITKNDKTFSIEQDKLGALVPFRQEEFWLLWKRWKSLCVKRVYSQYQFKDMLVVDYLNLPNEPVKV